MNKETELTLKLKGMGVELKDGSPGLAKWKTPWTIESALAWLREKGWKYHRTWEEDNRLLIVVFTDDINFHAFVRPSDELEGLLECMLRIVEGER